MKWIVCLTAAVAVVSMGVKVTRASGPPAVYALIDKVMTEPDADHPQRIRMDGVFMISSQPAGCGTCALGYSKPQRGYLYFSLPGQQSELALREWNDLKSVAGTRQVVTFGTSWYGNEVRLRKAEEKAESPDPFVMGNGVLKMSSDQNQARELLDYKDR